jgi:BRCT domain type II-containing protein
MACADMIIAFSGFRDENLKAQIEEAEGKVTASIAKNTTHLLVKKDGKPSKKVDDAKEKGIEIIDLDDFIEEHKFHVTEKKTTKAAKKTVKKSSDSSDGEHDEHQEHHDKHETDMEILAKIMHTLTTKSKKSEAIKALDELKTRINKI